MSVVTATGKLPVDDGLVRTGVVDPMTTVTFALEAMATGVVIVIVFVLLLTLETAVVGVPFTVTFPAAIDVGRPGVVPPPNFTMMCCTVVRAPVLLVVKPTVYVAGALIAVG